MEINLTTILTNSARGDNFGSKTEKNNNKNKESNNKKKEEISKKDIKKILNYHSKHMVFTVLEIVNLKDKERQAIELTELRGHTIEKTAEEMKCSIESIKKYRKSAFFKMSKAWVDNDLINKILEEG